MLGQSTLNSHDLIEGKYRRNTFALFNEYNFLFREALLRENIISYWLNINTKNIKIHITIYLVIGIHITPLYLDYSFTIFDAY